MSGMSEANHQLWPASSAPVERSPLAYPQRLLTEWQLLRGSYVHVYAIVAIERFAITACRQHGRCGYVVTDWAGQYLERAIAEQLIGTIGIGRLRTLNELLGACRINWLQFYFAGSPPQLIDVRQDQRRWASPGMVNDLFGSVLVVQSPLLSTTLSEDALPQIVGLEKPVILKPNRFRATEDGTMPLYVQIGKCIALG